ncbi:hypothetical protein ABW19_dt0206459 [Dactylella cylindrospora]|nr:hypothetical protein ABW19_dt0206459 [Dactylella cylindrospora]
MHIPSLAAIGAATLLPILVSADSIVTPASIAGGAATNLPDFSNPYHRLSFDEHRYPPPPPPALDSEKALKKRQEGSANFIVHMCRDAQQADCDIVWVSAAQYCYDNFHWFGWKGGSFVSAKVEGTMCCSFWTDATCNKAGGHVGWLTQICGDDTGDALLINGAVSSWMCNIPYGSAGVKMSESPDEVLQVPAQNSGAPVATQYAP